MDKIGGRMRKCNGETDKEFYERQYAYKQGIAQSDEEGRKRVVDQIQSYIDNKKIGSMGKRDLRSLHLIYWSQLFNAPTK